MRPQAGSPPAGANMLSVNHEQNPTMSPRGPSSRSRPSRMVCSIVTWPQPDLSEHPETGFDEKIDLEPRIAVAKVDGTALEHQPVASPANRNTGKPKLGARAAQDWRARYGGCPTSKGRNPGLQFPQGRDAASAAPKGPFSRRRAQAARQPLLPRFGERRQQGVAPNVSDPTIRPPAQAFPMADGGAARRRVSPGLDPLNPGERLSQWRYQQNVGHTRTCQAFRAIPKSPAPRFFPLLIVIQSPRTNGRESLSMRGKTVKKCGRPRWWGCGQERLCPSAVFTSGLPPNFDKTYLVLMALADQS